MNLLPLLADDTVNLEHLDNLDRLADLASAAHSAPALIGALTGLIAVLLIFGMPVIIVVAVLMARARRQRRLNDLILKLAEKGQPVPPELFIEPRSLREGKSPDARRGIFWASIGAGIVLFGLFDSNGSLAGIGCIPMMIGIGFFLASRLEERPPQK